DRARGARHCARASRVRARERRGPRHPAARGPAARVTTAGPMPDEEQALGAITSMITRERIRALLVELARVPSPLTELLEAEPQLRAFIDWAVDPRLRTTGVTDIRRDHMGNLVATYGRGESGRSLMLVTNAMNQPAATMPNPYGGEIRDGTAYGLPGDVVLG